MQFQKMALAAALAAAACAAQAADVQIYGRVDAGLRYTHTKSDDTLALQAGNRAHNRIGLNIVEDLGNGMKVKGYFENGFTLDDGELDDESMLFNRRSILSVAGSWGEFAMGRMGTVQSTMAPFTMGLIKYDPFATSYSQASIGTTFANTSRTNNTVTWISPTWNGWKVGATYSLGDSADDEYDDYTDRDHTLALAADYTGENLYLSFTFASVAYGDQETKATGGEDDETPLNKDAAIYGFGGWYRWIPESQIFFGVQYAKHWEQASDLKLSDVGKWQGKADRLGGGFDSYSLLLGANYSWGRHKVIGDVQYVDAELCEASDLDYKLGVVALAYEYKLASKVWFYVAATHTMASGSLDAVEDNESTELMSGINWNF